MPMCPCAVGVGGVMGNPKPGFTRPAPASAGSRPAEPRRPRFCPAFHPPSPGPRQGPARAIGGDSQQEVDLVSLFRDAAAPCVHMCANAGAARQLIARAFRIAKADRAVTCVIFPNDIEEMDAVEAPPRRHGSIFTGVGYEHPRIVPKDEELRKAADVLNQGKKVAMLVGAGALNAQDEVLETADLPGAAAAKALLGKAALPDDLPFVTGAIGLLGTRASYSMMMECDTLLVAGSSF